MESSSNTSRSLAGLDVLDLLFLNKNKAYGAYSLRKSYPKHIRNALIYGVALIILAVLIPTLVKAISGILPAEKIDVIAELGPPPSIDPDQPPPPPPPKVETPPPPPRPTIKFVPPVVKKDEEVKEEEQIVKQEDLDKNVDISNKTVEGDTTSTVITVVEDLGPPKEVEVAKVEEEKPFQRVEQMPAFPGGEKELLKFLADNIRYPAIASENGIEGRVILRFVVDKNGGIDNIEVIKDIGGGCTEEAIRVVKKMPAWSAGKQNGRPVKVYFTLPVNFKLN